MTEPPEAKRRRPWVIPPALLQLPAEEMRGTEIIRENPNELGLVLWHLHRDVELWAGAAPNKRSKLFRGTRPRTRRGAIPHYITGPLAVLRAMLSSDVIGGGPAACQAIGAWSAPRAPGTALLFAQAGAMLEPRDAAAAHVVAVHANDAGYASLAMSWANRAMALARRARDWHTYASALIEIARANCTMAEDTSLARTALLRVLRVHRRSGLHPDLRARALLTLFRLELGATEGATSTTDRLQRAALRCYAASDPRRADVVIALARSLSEAGRHSAATALLNQHTGALTRDQAEEVRRLFAPPLPPPAPVLRPEQP